MKILVLNAGSSSQKSRLYELGDSLPDNAPSPLWEADADWGQHSGSTTLKVKNNAGATLEEELQTDARPEVIQRILETLWSGKTRVIEQAANIDMVGHRVVHGGLEFEQSTRVTPQVKDAIARLVEIAPQHNPANLAGIEAIDHILPSVLQVAVFDTAFHRSMPLPNVVYPGPYVWFEQGIRRYGFHGISYQYCTRRAGQVLGRDVNSLRIIACHLGNGCSMAAIQNGHSIDTSMGFTPLEGLMMGTRSGSVDPGILFYLQREKGQSAEDLDTTLNKSSGLKGISGSSDMRQVLQQMRNGDIRAKLAFDMFVHRLCFYIGAMLATLGGADALIFTGGIGENAPEVRAAACESFGFLSLKLDQQKNSQSPPDQDIAAPDSSMRVLIIHAEEDWEIARECWKLAKN